MRDAFVLRFTPDTQPLQHGFAGWIEEVDTGREFHFKSGDELLAYLAGCLGEARERARRAPDSSGNES
ncbi:MAG TPA: hypothetical protein VMS04_23960 [Vicinamibacterales bacterium]|nr:hypothetical protein [Vicinamibacterales bacterium]